MTKQEMKKAIIKAVKEGMGEKIRTIFVDLDTPTDTVIRVGITYGRFGIETVIFSLQHIMGRHSAYQIYKITGSANIYHIKGINEELNLIVSEELK